MVVHILVGEKKDTSYLLCCFFSFEMHMMVSMDASSSWSLCCLFGFLFSFCFPFIFIYASRSIFLYVNVIFRTYVWQGGAGTWSDGKLVTRIGRNSGSVLAVRYYSFALVLFHLHLLQVILFVFSLSTYVFTLGTLEHVSYSQG